jgi:hypothetical protein
MPQLPPTQTPTIQISMINESTGAGRHGCRASRGGSPETSDRRLPPVCGTDAELKIVPKGLLLLFKAGKLLTKQCVTPANPQVQISTKGLVRCALAGVIKVCHRLSFGRGQSELF